VSFESNIINDASIGANVPCPVPRPVAANAARGPASPLPSLIADIGRGEANALTLLYHQTATFVYAMASNVLRRKEDTEEVVCDVFVAVWKNARHYDATRGSVLAWLATLTRNRSIDRLRLLKLRSRLAVDDVDGGHESPEEMLSLFQQGSIVHGALARLSPTCRQLIALAFFQGLSHQRRRSRLTRRG
jgi:RNA polymerase sigma-70 factor (ECF subfamily)